MNVNNIPTIADCNYFFIKTNNGKHYHEFREASIVSLYSDKYPKDIDTFKDIHEGDIVLIPGFRNKIMSIGMIISDYYYDNTTIARKVKWIKEITSLELDFKFQKYFYSTKVINRITLLDSYIDRLLYPVFIKNDNIHIVLKVKQKENIMCKSIYGLQNLILDCDKVDDLTMKINVQSPGIIEFITKSLSVAEILVQVFKLVVDLCTSDDKSKKKKRETDEMAKKYYDYEVDKLELEIPDLKELEHD